MPSDYNAITEHNECQLGQDTASRKTQISMYSDPTHFVYEILQNADDYGAIEVLFKLSENELQIEHDGEPFTEENVKAITYFGKSTSRDDLVKTGRFGVGFKSVFAFTATPIIISGDEHFQIHGLYRVKEYPYPDNFPRSRTRIVLPFNHKSEQPDYVEDLMPREEAYSKISTRLTTLNINTLLFTRNIREIRWEIEDHSGHYLREDDTNGNVRRTTIIDGDQLKKYLVFSRVPQWEKQKYKAVEIVFGIDEKNQIVPAKDFLYVLFATTHETHLRFVLNGPYRTNPSRETISGDDPFNVHLVKETCELMKEVLPQLREKNLLTTQFLSVLPNRNDGLRDFYAPLFETIVETFREQALVPTDDNGYASAANVLLGPTPIREVITKEELPFFTGRDAILWAKGVRPNSPADNFLGSLGIESWGWEQLQKVLEDKYGWSWSLNDSDEEWLAARSDTWLQKLYLILAEAIKKSECSEWILKRCRIIRVLEGGRQNYAKGPEAYFPKRGYRELPHIKPVILQGKNQQTTQRIHESLITLGVSDIGDEERIDLLLETFYDDTSAEVSPEQHLQHLKTFIRWWKKEKSASKFNDYAIFYSGEKKSRRKPREAFLDSPLKQSGLSVIYLQNTSNLPQKFKLWNGYEKLDLKEFCEFAVACGVADRLFIEPRSCWQHPRQSEMMEGLLNARKSSAKKDLDYHIRNLSELLELKNREINLLIWCTISQADPKVFEASYRPSRQYEIRTYKSSLVLELTDAEWIPDKKGHLHKSCDLTKEDLHQDFKYDNRNRWLDEVNFGEKAKKASEEYKKRKEQALSIGVPMEMADYLAGLPEEERKKEHEELKALFKRKAMQRRRGQHIQQKSIPPYDKALSDAFSAPGKGRVDNNGGNGGFSPNPSRRRKRTSEDITAAIDNKGAPEDRSYFSVRKNWKGKNDQVRADFVEWYGGRCQICEWTFTRRNGEPYFEGLYLVSRTTADWIDRVGNVLCLCAQHSAMFQFGSKEAADIIQQVIQLKAKAEGGDGYPAIRMNLCGDPIEIKFAEKHLIDLQEMIKTA